MDKVAMGLDETAERVMGVGPHLSPTAKVNHDGLWWLAMWRTAVDDTIKAARSSNETVEPGVGFGRHYYPIEQDGFLQTELHHNAYVKEHVNEIVFRESLTGEFISTADTGRLKVFYQQMKNDCFFVRGACYYSGTMPCLFQRH